MFCRMPKANVYLKKKQKQNVRTDIITVTSQLTSTYVYIVIIINIISGGGKRIIIRILELIKNE